MLAYVYNVSNKTEVQNANVLFESAQRTMQTS